MTTTTPETPSDEELYDIGAKAVAKAMDSGEPRGALKADVFKRAIYQAGFTRGEQRGLERAIERLRTYDKGGGRSVPNALALIESLRAAPAEPSRNPGELDGATSPTQPNDQKPA